MYPRTLLLAASLLTLTSGICLADDGPILPALSKSQLQVVSTVPSNGDLNPYGVAFVHPSFPGGGLALGGDILVSNFNNSANLQGTGTTIVSVTPGGSSRLFFQGSGLGLTTALGVLSRGIVLVGNLPAPMGACASIQTSSLLVLDKHGKLVNTLTSSLLNGPWDLKVHESGDGSQVFVSNVLSGTVTRLDLDVSDGQATVKNMTQIASGYGHRCDPNALVVGPTGLAYDREKHLLYVASTEDNAIFAVPGADTAQSDHGQGTMIYHDNAHLRGPVGLVLAPNGNLIATNGDAINGDPAHPSEMIEFTPSGSFVAAVSVDTGGQGGAFGLAINGVSELLRFAAVDDINNTLKVWAVHPSSTNPDKTSDSDGGK
jgi:hypothetical protein